MTRFSPTSQKSNPNCHQYCHHVINPEIKALQNHTQLLAPTLNKPSDLKAKCYRRKRKRKDFSIPSAFPPSSSALWAYFFHSHHIPDKSKNKRSTVWKQEKVALTISCITCIQFVVEFLSSVVVIEHNTSHPRDEKEISKFNQLLCWWLSRGTEQYLK